MYPVESYQDSPADRQRKILAKLFWLFVATTLLLATTALYVNLYSARSSISDALPMPKPSPSASTSVATGSSSDISLCNSVVATNPGDLKIVLSWGWEIDCVASGDPLLGEHGDLYTYGYADEFEKRIVIDAPEVTASTIAHEAAHVIDYEQLVDSERSLMAAKYGMNSWGEGSDYFKQPAEMFAESRARCLGYRSDSEILVMSCDDVDKLIGSTDLADQINSMATEN